MPQQNRAPIGRFVSVNEAAAILDVSTRSVRTWIADGTLPAYRVAHKVVRIRESELLAILSPIPAAD